MKFDFLRTFVGASEVDGFGFWSSSEEGEG